LTRRAGCALNTAGSRRKGDHGFKNMHLIVADVLPLAEAGHDAPEAAISSAQKFNEDRQKDELPLVIGGEVNSVEFGTEAIRMYCGRHGISCFYKAGGVDYEIFSGVQRRQWGTEDLSDDTVEVRLRKQQFVWERGRILNQFIGQTLHKVFVSPAGLFLYASNIDILNVTALLDLERSKPFLYWQFTD
jgi:hypothetical protein